MAPKLAVAVAGGPNDHRRSGVAVAFAAVLAPTLCLAPVAAAQSWRFSASAAAQATYTNNSDFGSSERHSDLVGSVTTTLGIIGGPPRTKLSGSIALTALVDSRGNLTGTVAPAGALNGTFEAIENFAYVDVSAALAQTYVSPFGPQPRDLVNDTNNRYTSQTDSVAPYVRSVLPGGISYTVRDQNTWSVASSTANSAVTPPTQYTNSLTAKVDSPPARLGWSIDYSRTYFDSGAPVGTSTVETLRGLLPYRVNPELEVGLRAGYERDEFLGVRTQSSIYGAGARWQPTDRTNVSGFWEHRYFGSSYNVQIAHRLPRVALTATFSRDLANYPQLALTIPAGADVASYVNAAFTTRIPDPSQRAQAVQQFIARSGLAGTLFTPVNFFTTTFVLQTSETVSAAWLGLRNSIAVTAFRFKSEAPVAGIDPALPREVLGDLQFTPNNTQIGSGVTFSRSLSPFTTLSANATVARVTSNASSETSADRATNTNFNLGLATALGPRTTGSVGAGYAKFVSHAATGSGSTSAVNVFAAVAYVFR